MNASPNIQLHGDNSNILLANEYFDPEDAAAQAYDLGKSKDIGEALNSQYPGHLWAVRVQSKQGIATIRDLAQAIRNGEDCWFALHDAFLEHGCVLHAGIPLTISDTLAISLILGEQGPCRSAFGCRYCDELRRAGVISDAEV